MSPTTKSDLIIGRLNDAKIQLNTRGEEQEDERLSILKPALFGKEARNAEHESSEAYQWPAVKIQCSLMIEPPQWWNMYFHESGTNFLRLSGSRFQTLKFIETCHGIALSVALRPAMRKRDRF